MGSVAIRRSPLIRELPGQGPPKIVISVARCWYPNVANKDPFADRQSGTRFGCPPVNSEIIAAKLAIAADARRLERCNIEMVWAQDVGGIPQRPRSSFLRDVQRIGWRYEVRPYRNHHARP